MESNYTLLDNDSLEHIAKVIGRTEAEISEIVVKTFYDIDIIMSLDDCGKTIGELIDGEFSVKQAIEHVLGYYNKEIETSFSNLVIWGAAYECPECGCSLDEVPESSSGYEWVDIDCTNCDYADTNEPDWDIMPGGYGYNN